MCHPFLAEKNPETAKILKIVQKSRRRCAKKSVLVRICRIFRAFPIPKTHLLLRSPKPTLLCGLAFSLLFLGLPRLLYGDPDETRSRFCARVYRRSVRDGALGSLRPARSVAPSHRFLACRGAWALQAGHRLLGAGSSGLGCAGLRLGSYGHCYVRKLALGLRFCPVALPGAHR